MRPLVVLAAALPACAAALASPLAAQVAVPDSVTSARIVEGAALFDAGSCSRCHGPAGIGGRNGPSLADSTWLHSTGDWDGVFHTVWWGVEDDEKKADPPFRFEMHPRGGMPWTRAQTSAAVAYVWALSRPATHRITALQAEFLAHATGGRADRAVATFRAAATELPESPLLGEGGLNAVAYRVLEAGDAAGAVALFELNAELHPESANVWDSLAEGHTALGHRERAIELYEKALEMDPSNDNAREKLAELRGS